MKILTEEHKRKIGLAHKGRVISQEQREKIRRTLTGRKLNDEVRTKLKEVWKREGYREYQSSIRKGVRIPQERIERIRQSLIGRKHSEVTKKKIGDAHKGKKLEEYQIEALRKSHLDKPLSQRMIDDMRERNKGEGNPNWKGGITKEWQTARNSEEYKTWRDGVFRRDKYVCQCCKDITKHNLNAHHLVGFSKRKDQRYVVENGITLCKECHRLLHRHQKDFLLCVVLLVWATRQLRHAGMIRGMS